MMLKWQRVAALTVVALVAPLAACGSSSGGATSGKTQAVTRSITAGSHTASTPAIGGSSARGTTPASLPSLTVGTAAPLTNFADLYVAQARGYFDKAGVKVNIKTAVGAGGLNQVVSGQLDLLMFGTGQALIAKSRGADVKIVYNQIGAGEDAVVAVKASSPYKTLTDLSGKRMSVLGVGGSSYGWGQFFANYIADHGGTKPNVIQSSSVSIQVDGLLSGHFDAVISTAALLTDEIAQNKIRLLVDPTQESGKSYIPSQYAETVTFGIGKNLDSKRQAVVAFVAGMRAADSWLKTASPDDIATTLKTDPAFNGQSKAAVAAGAKFDKSFYAPSLGEITPDLWASTLKQLKFWGLPGLDLASSKFSFNSIVDMSYLDAAKSIKVAG